MNIPSVIKIEYIKKKKVNLPAFIDPGTTLDISPYITDVFTTLPMSGQASASDKPGKNGEMISSSSFKIADITAETSALLHRLSQSGNVYRLTDASGLKYLIGSNHTPAQLSYTQYNPESHTEFRGYNCTIACSSLSGLIYCT